MPRPSAAPAKPHLPIVFIHSGGDSYLACSLAQARQSNPKADIYLVGDRFNRGFPGIIHLEWQDYAESAREFAKVYQHRNTNPYQYELFCFQRWFVLNEVLQKRQLPGCLYLDSDVLLYERTERVAPRFAAYGLTTSLTSPHCMFIQQPGALAEFCKFLFACYQEPKLFAAMDAKYQSRIAAGREGGACDMTAFGLFASKGTVPVAELATSDAEIACDNAMASDEGGYAMLDGVKRIEWRDGMPLGFHQPTNRQVKFDALHFQGPSKGRIFKYMRLQTWRDRLRFLWMRLIAKRGKYWQKWLRRSGKAPTE